MPPAQAAISAEFVSRLAERAQEADRLRRLPAATITDLIESNFTELLVPARYGGAQADFPAILDPVRRMAHGCASSAWTLGFYALHNWILALFDERAQEEAFATRPFLAPAPLAPTGRGAPSGGGIRLTGRWSWATGVMDRNWIIVGALCGPDDAMYPALALLPISEIQIEDVWRRAEGQADRAGPPGRGAGAAACASRQPAAADQARRRCAFRSCDIRLRHQSRTRRGAHTGA